MPGVVAVYNSDGDDLGLASLRQFTMMPETLNRPIFATGKVRFVGEVIAAVVAETRAAAVDAAESVVVDYDELPVVMSPVDALASDAPLLFPDHGPTCVSARRSHRRAMSTRSPARTSSPRSRW